MIFYLSMRLPFINHEKREEEQAIPFTTWNYLSNFTWINLMLGILKVQQVYSRQVIKEDSNVISTPLHVNAQRQRSRTFFRDGKKQKTLIIDYHFHHLLVQTPVLEENCIYFLSDHVSITMGYGRSNAMKQCKIFKIKSSSQ